MNEQQREKNFNLMIAAFRQMEGDSRTIKGMLTIALNDTRWGSFRKFGITQDALEVARKNRAEFGDGETYKWFKNLEAAHKTSRAEYCLRLVLEDLPNPYQYLLEIARCVIATKAENKTPGWDHFSKIHPLSPELFGHGASNFVLKRHPDYPAFVALLEGTKPRLSGAL
jgi:hypothetical protein